MKGGLMLLMGKPKSPDDDSEDEGAPDSNESSGADGVERSYAKEAFAAAKDDDESGFVDAFLGAVRACVAKAKSGGYAADDEEDDDAA